MKQAELKGGIARHVNDLRQFVRARQARVREVMLLRTTQTSEPTRCTMLLPLLAQLPQPVALLEVGASAGLCLLLDHYGYDYGNARIGPTVSGDGHAPVFTFAVSGPVPLLKTIPSIAWRAGLDLNPIDVRSESDAAWVETLVWPEQNEQLARLYAAINIARRDPRNVVRGDLLTDSVKLLATAPRHGTVVAFHTAELGDRLVVHPGRWLGYGPSPGANSRDAGPTGDRSGLDISKDAAPLDSWRWPTLAFATSDLRAEWPVRDTAVDLIVSILAPPLRPCACPALENGLRSAIAAQII
jgi:hypothetical protein